MHEFVRISQLHEALRDLQFIHIGGTNGKGSVTAYVQELADAFGYRSGGYFSPYVYDVRERIQVDCKPVDRRLFADAVAALQPSAEALHETSFGGPTEFEFKTAMGFWIWRKANCQWIALEVGLGGRLDATNVVDSACSAIVSIGWDHMEFLGDSLEKIATEKAGIFKPGKPVVIGKIEDVSARESLLKRAYELNAPVYEYGHEFWYKENTTDLVTPFGTVHSVEAGLLGSMQLHNASVAIMSVLAAGLPFDEAKLRDGVARTRLPGRFQTARWQGVEFVLDGAHNVDAARVLLDSLKSSGREKIVLLAGMLQGHDPLPFFAALRPVLSSLHLTPIDFHRTQSSHVLRSALCPVEESVYAHDSLKDALHAATEDAKKCGLPVVVTGSFYLVGEVGRAIRADADFSATNDAVENDVSDFGPGP